MTTSPRDPAAFQTTVESARLALRQAGPHSGLHGAAASCMDRKLTEIVEWLGEIVERRRERLAADAQPSLPMEDQP